MDLFSILVGFPLVVALFLLFLPDGKGRAWLVKGAALVITLLSLLIVREQSFQGFLVFNPNNQIFGTIVFGLEMLIAIYLLVYGFKNRNYSVCGLVVVQTLIGIYLELHHAKIPSIERAFFIDNLSSILILIVGIIGSLIAVYAISYMREYHEHHSEVKDRSKQFFGIIFVFLAAMFGLVSANNMMYLYFFWEITTVASFLLIGYTQTEEAMKNAFRALQFNLIGGIAFILALVYFAESNLLELQDVLSSNAVMVLPIVLLAIAALSKSAQLPFSTWLLGAMVAPTPVSALLHSSTMVKAGVYLLVRIAPKLQGTSIGLGIAYVGMLTFLATSCLAISQSDGKRVLAYSTIANLGLIVACCGIGTSMTIWAAIFLIIFHAIAKSLLFLGVGSIEHVIGERNIEFMDGLIVRMPQMAYVMAIGIVGMFIAPFGMLISKWIALEAIVEVSPLLGILLAFGSAATILFWVKWLAKLFMFTGDEKVEMKISPVLLILSLFVIIFTFVYPLVSLYSVEPYLQNVLGSSFALGLNNILIMSVILLVLAFLLLSIFFYRKDIQQANIYLAGANEGSHSFTGSMGNVQNLEFKNYYLEKYFSEKKLLPVGTIFCLIILVILVGVNL